MQQGPLFRRWFHEELDALDRFFAEGVRVRELSAGTEDPDVRRIVEALAFFSARTRAAAASSMRSAIVRMAGGLLDDLFAPVSATAMLRADPDRLLDGPAELPLGTRFRVETHDGRPSIFVTKRALSLRPISVAEVLLARPHRGVEIRIRLVAKVPQKGPVQLPLLVRRHGDYGASAELFEAISDAFLRAVVKKDDGVEHPCQVTFGPAAPETPWDEQEVGSPLGRIRSFFHSPEHHLFIHLGLPAEGGAWKKADITLSLDLGFPEDLIMTRDSLLPFVVPAENAWTDLADPMIVDGTNDAAEIRHPQSVLPAVEPVLVRGVYRAAGDALAPLPPRSLAQDGTSYEVLFPEDDAPMIRVYSDEAVAQPFRAHVDAVWSQPSLWSNARGPLLVKPQRRKLEGVVFNVLGNVRPALLSPLSFAPEKGLDVLALRQKPALDRADLRALLQLLGASETSPYARFPSRLSGVVSRWAPDPLGGRGPRKRVYQISMEPPPFDEKPLAPSFHRQLCALLDAWAPEAAEVETTLLLPPGKEHAP